MWRLFHDEDALQASVMVGLRRAGFDCLTVSEVQRRGYSDESHLDYATSHGRVVFTKNTADFCRLHEQWLRAGKHHAGIVVLTDHRAHVGTQLRAFEKLVTLRSMAEMGDRLEFLLNYA